MRAMTDGHLCEPMPADVALAIAIAPVTRWGTRGARPRLPVRDVAPLPTACDGVHAAQCDPVMVYHAGPRSYPIGMSHRVPVDASPVVTTADVLASVEACRLACEGMAARRVTYPLRPVAPPAPATPDELGHVDGTDAAASRRARLARIGELIRGAGELAGLLAGEPEAVVARARAALARLV